MARDVVINGECMALVRFGAHISGFIDGPLTLVGIPTASPAYSTQTPQLFSLGLSSDSVTISPKINYKNVYADDLGQDVPVEVLYRLSECNIRMTLVHYDQLVLDQLVAESMGGATSGGTMVANSTPLGGLHKLEGFTTALSTAAGVRGWGGSSGCHFAELWLTSPVLGLPYRFPATHLADQPVVVPLGTKRSLVGLNFRAIPYYVPESTTIASVSGDQASAYEAPSEFVSSGAVLWTRTLSYLQAPI